MAEVLIAVDQGTTNTKALLVNRSAQPVFRASRPMGMHSPQAGFIEQDAIELWTTVCAVIRECAVEAARRGDSLEGIAITNQRETAVAWDRETGAPLGPAVSWQCRRSADICERVARQWLQDGFGRSGLPLDPLLTAGKWAWMLENNPEVSDAADRGTLGLGTVDAWLVSRLTLGQVHATDTSNASRTGLLNLATLAWDRELLSLFAIPSTAMPSIQPSSGIFGRCGHFSCCPEIQDMPIVSVIGDSHAALAAYGCAESGTIKATYGTGSSLMVLTSTPPEYSSQLARTVAWTMSDEGLASGTRYALEGNVSMAGAGLQWVGEFLGLADPALSAANLAIRVDGAAGMYFVPAMVGLGAPYWDSHARGLVCGLERSHTAAHLARASIEAIAYQVADVFFSMREAIGSDLPILRADGGATRNDSLMQFQADVLGVPVVRSACEDLSALGAACLGGVTLGWWPGLQVAGDSVATHDTFVPRWTKPERVERYAGWKEAVRRARLNSGEFA